MQRNAKECFSLIRASLHQQLLILRDRRPQAAGQPSNVFQRKVPSPVLLEPREYLGRMSLRPWGLHGRTSGSPETRRRPQRHGEPCEKTHLKTPHPYPYQHGSGTGMLVGGVEEVKDCLPVLHLLRWQMTDITLTSESPLVV